LKTATTAGFAQSLEKSSPSATEKRPVFVCAKAGPEVASNRITSERTFNG
jgi:hypothetical protein